MKTNFKLAILATALIVSCGTKNKNEIDQLSKSKETLKKNVEMYSTVWERVVEERNTGIIDTSFFDPNVIVITQEGNIEGIEAFKDFYNNYLTGFSDAQFKVLDCFGQGDRLVKHWQFIGTHDGDFFGIPATNQKIDLKGTTLVTMKNGRVYSEEDFFDNYSLLTQLGIIKQ